MWHRYTDYFKLFQDAAQSKYWTLNSLLKVKQRYGNKNDWWAKSSIYIFFIHCHNGIGSEEKVKEENLDSGMAAEAEQQRSL